MRKSNASRGNWRTFWRLTKPLDGTYRQIWFAALVFATAYLVVVWIVLVPHARAHDALSGWTYPIACCSGFDCRAVPADWIEERPEGFRIVGTGEVVPMTDSRVRHSPDGDFHRCSVAGIDDGRTICLFVPPRAF